MRAWICKNYFGRCETTLAFLLGDIHSDLNIKKGGTPVQVDLNIA
jgi:hypothetical protein